MPICHVSVGKKEKGFKLGYVYNLHSNLKKTKDVDMIVHHSNI